MAVVEEQFRETARFLTWAKDQLATAGAAVLGCLEEKLREALKQDACPGRRTRTPSRYCVDCVLRNNVTRSLRHGERVREKTVMELRQEQGTLTVELMVTTAPVTVEGRPLALLILEDISELVQLRRLLPICSKCKKIRDDQEYWHSLESYMGKNLDLTFTHGICPTCAKEMLAEIAAMRRRP